MPTYLSRLGETERLVDAPNQAAALRHVATSSISIAVATIADAARLGKAGVEIERAGDAVVEFPVGEAG
jgi:hypothetical protein